MFINIEKKEYIQLFDFVIQQNFQIFVDKINQRKTSANWRENTKIMGSCALQSFEIYAQMLHYERKNNYRTYYVLDKEGYLDENFCNNPKNSKLLTFLLNADLSPNNKNFYSSFYTKFYKMMYGYDFHHIHFLKMSNLRALLERDEFFKVPILCNIQGWDMGHINILFRGTNGLYCINTNENSPNKIKLIQNYNGDLAAFEQISYNWTGEFELVRSFELFVPYELVKKKVKIKNTKFKTKNIEQNAEEMKHNQGSGLSLVFMMVMLVVFIVFIKFIVRELAR